MPIMTGMVAGLSDEDMRNLAAYFAAQKPRPGAAQRRDAGHRRAEASTAAATPAPGVPACSGCHSPNGAGIPAQFPRLKGQHLRLHAGPAQGVPGGERANDPSSMMRTIAARMSDQEMAAVAEYIPG